MISVSADGLKETVYKVYCGYNIEGERFFHAINSTHVVVGEDLFDVDIDSCDLAESVEYQGYGSDEEGGEVSDSSALIAKAKDATNEFVEREVIQREYQEMDDTQFLAKSKMIGEDEVESDEYGEEGEEEGEEKQDESFY